MLEFVLIINFRLGSFEYDKGSGNEFDFGLIFILCQVYNIENLFKDIKLLSPK